MNSFYDLQKFPQFQIKSSYDFFIYLLDGLFGKDSYKSTITIDQSAETEKNHKFLLDEWNTIHTLYKTPNNTKKIQKLVRQTIKQIIEYLNETHKFTQPIRIEPKRTDFYQKGYGLVTKRWLEISLI
jgi:hypothetical protein